MEAVKNAQRGGSLNLAAEGHKTPTPLKVLNGTCTPLKLAAKVKTPQFWRTKLWSPLKSRNCDFGLFWTNFGKFSVNFFMTPLKDKDNALIPIKILNCPLPSPWKYWKWSVPPPLNFWNWSVAPLKTRDPLDVFDTFSNYNWCQAQPSPSPSPS